MKQTALVALLALAACGNERNRTISSGEKFTSADYTVPGKVIILDFFADW